MSSIHKSPWYTCVMAKLRRRMLVTRFMMFILVAATIAAATEKALPPPQLALPDCDDHCGNITVPYPFGIGDGCYRGELFNLTCDKTAQPPILLWADGEVNATNIFLAEAEFQILDYIAHDCYDKDGHQTESMYNFPSLSLAPPFTISSSRNKFMAVGCDTYAIFKGYRPFPNDEERYITGCMSVSDSLDSSINESCTGIGCCQTSIPSGLGNRSINLDSYSNHTSVWDFNPCSYAFLVEEGKFMFNRNTSFQELSNTRMLPVILNWEIDDGPCAKAQNRSDYACKANTECVNRTIDIHTEPSGYYCLCSPGFEGNPYLPHGCQDIDECQDSINPCSNGTCNNLVGSYNCTCNKGFRNDNVTRCIPVIPISKNKSLKIWLGVCLGSLAFVVAISWVHCIMNRRKIIQLKKKNFKENGGLTLEQHLARHGGGDTTKIYTAEELEKATINYHESRVIGEGGYGTVYKGILQDNKVVAIKKSKVGSRTQSDQFVNEVIFLSQINHKNVVRLLGCCFETEVPLLVYEYITHGTLFEHVFAARKEKGSLLPWELRLKIASETAEALAYLHSSTSTPIVHRDVKATNILLDQNFTAKVSDFGASRFIPLDQTEVATLVQGTMGYLDPEYLQSNTLTEKSDVYSFGVVLAELITSKGAISFARSEEDRSLASLFISSMAKKSLIHILDEEIVNEGNIETIEQVAVLASRCLKLKGEERPTMREVASELEGMRITTKHPWKNSECNNPEETQHLLGSPNSAYAVDIRGEGDTSGGITSRFDSFQVQTLMPFDGTTSSDLTACKFRR